MLMNLVLNLIYSLTDNFESIVEDSALEIKDPKS